MTVFDFIQETGNYTEDIVVINSLSGTKDYEGTKENLPTQFKNAKICSNLEKSTLSVFLMPKSHTTCRTIYARCDNETL